MLPIFFASFAISAAATKLILNRVAPKSGPIDPTTIKDVGFTNEDGEWQSMMPANAVGFNSDGHLIYGIGSGPVTADDLL